MQTHILKSSVFYFALMACIALCHSHATAQGRWKSGYVVLKNGDTLHGQVAYIDKEKSPRKAIFRKEKGGLRKKYTPTEIRCFTVIKPLQRLYFKSFTAYIDLSSDKLESLADSAAPRFKKYDFFAQLLADGPKKLYVYTDTVTGKKHFLVEGSPDSLTDLINKRYYTDVSKTTISLNDDYKNQLSNFYADCPAMGAKTNATAYNSADMMKLAGEYNSCKGITNGYEYKRERTKAHFGIMAGAGMTGMKIKGLSDEQITFPPGPSAAGGIFLNVVAPHTETHWAWYNELSFSHYQTIYNTFRSGNYMLSQATIAATYINLLTALRVQMPYRSIKPFMQLGIINGYAMVLSTNTTYSSRYSVQPDGPLMYIRRYEQSVFGGAGILYNRYEAEIRCAAGNGISPYSTVSTYQNLSAFCSSIIFFKGDTRLQSACKPLKRFYLFDEYSPHG